MEIKKPLKEKTCKECKEKFTPSRSLQPCCSVTCAIAFARRQTQIKYEKEQRRVKSEKIKVNRIKLDAIKSKSEHLKELQDIFNLFIRLRDEHLPCISCGTMRRDIQYHAGHFYSVGAYPALRYHEDNVHKQCGNNCNKNKHGNIIEYRPRLIERIGQERYDALEALKGSKLQLSIPEIKELKMQYKEKINTLKKKNN